MDNNSRQHFQDNFEFWVCVMLGLLLAISGFLFFTKTTSAATFEQPTSDTTSFYSFSSGHTVYSFNFASSSLSNFATSSDVTFLFKETNVNPLNMQVYFNYSFYPDAQSECSHVNMWSAPSGVTVNYDSGTQLATFTISSSSALSACIGSITSVSFHGGEQGMSLLGSAATSSIATGQWHSTGADPNMALPYFSFSGTSTGSPASTISLLTPTTSTVSDFRLWEVSYENTTTTAGKIKAGVLYSTASDPNVYADFSVSTTTASSTSFFLTKNRAIPLNEQWQALAQLYLIPDSNPETSIVLASSSIVAFTLTNPLGGGIYGTSTPSSTTSTLTITCDPSSGAFQYSFCYVFSYLFLPKSSDFDVFNDTYDELSTKPPFGYYNAIKDILGGFSTTTTSTLTFPDMTDLETPFGEMKTYLTVILWVAFGFWIFNKFRNIQL